MGTSVPLPSLGPLGFISPSDSDIMAGVWADVQAAFGGNLNEALETPQGQLVSSWTALLSALYDSFLFYTTQTDPAFAEGRMQDAIARIYFLARNPALPTTVTCTLTGLAGVIIPRGALATAADGNLYSCTTGGTIGSGGNVSLEFQCLTTGAIVCPANSLNQIYQAIPGWDTINNPADGIIGQDVESRSEFESRRRSSVELNAVGMLPAVQAAAFNVADVLDVYATENPTGSPITIQGVTLVAHSLYVCVLGGDDNDVGKAIWTKKSPGCAYNGNTTVTVTDSSNYSPPFPTYSVTFERPIALAVYIDVTIKNSPSVPSNALTLIQGVVVAAFTGADGGPRARIGATLFASRFYAGVAGLGAWAAIVSIKIGSTLDPQAVFTAHIAGTVMTVTAVASGTLAPGQIIDAPNVTPGTTIVSQSGGTTGGVGTYTVSVSLTVSSETMTSLTTNQDDMTLNINQAPTIANQNITVTLV